MKRACIAFVLASTAASQGVYVDSEKVASVAEQPSPLSLFLQQAPPSLAEPNFAVAANANNGPAAPMVAPTIAADVGVSPGAAAPVVVVNPGESVSDKLEEKAEKPPAVAEPPQGGLGGRPKGVLTLRSMRVANSGSEGSKVFFGPGNEFAMGTDSAGNFVMQQASSMRPLVSLDSSDTLRLGSQKVEALSLNAQNGISVRGVKQWQLVHSADFSESGAGWSRSDVSQCAGVYMLGGFCKFSRGDVNKTFSGLPPHKQLRVVATYHFIDRWIGETGFMKLDVGVSNCAVTVWSERHAQQEAKNGLSLCGSAETPEGKFAAPVDVTVPHHKDTVTVTFGSTMDDADPCDESWGISSMEIYVRD